MTTLREVVVVIGAGGIGQAIGRRQGTGRTVLLADRNEQTLAAAANALTSAGHVVETRPVDVSSREAVRAVAETAAELGAVVNVVHTAGLSPVQASPEAIIAVDLVGTALVLEELGRVVAAGGAGLVISSMAGHMIPPLPPEQNDALANTPADELRNLQFLNELPNSGAAYAISKRANQLRVQAESVNWGDRGARLNSVSPGIIITPLALEEMSGPGAAGYQSMIQNSAAHRAGTADELATVSALLLGDDGAFITGADLLIDGGVVAAIRAGRITLGGDLG